MPTSPSPIKARDAEFKTEPTVMTKGKNSAIYHQDQSKHGKFANLVLPSITFNSNVIPKLKLKSKKVA